MGGKEMPRRRKKKKIPRGAALATVLIATIVGVAAGVLLLTQPESRTLITGLMVDNIDCEVENCTVGSGASMVLSVGIQSSETIENVEVHVWGIWSPSQDKYQIDESRIVRLEAGKHMTENFETTAYCSPCAGINPGAYRIHAEISIDNEVLDNYETTIYLDSVPGGYTNVSPEEAKEMIDSDQNVVVLDVRTQAEYESGHILGAVLFPLQELEETTPDFDKDEDIIVYCAAGVRSEDASEILSERGFNQVYNLLGGLSAWTEAGFQVTTE
jgi:rhodanese-related sulfurtransferase